MSDFNGAKPVQTVRDDEFKIKLVDGQSGASATKVLSIVGEGDAFSTGVNDLGIPAIVKDKNGNAKILELDANDALPISDNGGAITVDATNLDIRDLSAASDSITAVISGEVAVSAVNLDIRDLTAASDSVKIGDGTDFLAINGDGSINATVSATNLDIRDLTSASDSIAAVQSGTWANQITDGTDTLAINGDGSINVAGSVTVSATNLDIRDLVYTSDSVSSYITDGTDSLAINGDGSINAVVSATDLDIRNLSHSQDSIKIGDGTDFAAISSTGEMSVSITQAQANDGATAPAQAVQVAGKDGSGNLQALTVDSQGRLAVTIDASAATAICDYQTSATVGVNNTVNHDYVVTNGKTFTGEVALVGARGAVKVEIGTYNGTTFTKKMVYFQDPKENRDHSIAKLTLAGNGTNAIRVAITNLDASSSDVYSTMQGSEI